MIDAVLTHPLCVTWCHGLNDEQALLRIGGLPQTMAHRGFNEAVTAAYDALPHHAGCALAGKLGQWTVLIEPNGFQGARLPLLADLSQGGQALSIFWNDKGDARIAYAERGRLIAAVDPFDPDPDAGEDPAEERFLQLWQDLAETEEDWRADALRLAETIVGQGLDADWFGEPMLSAIVQAPADAALDDAEAERQAYLREQRALLARDSRLAVLVHTPTREGLREMAAYAAQLVAARVGLPDALVEGVIAALRAQGEAAQRMKSHLGDIERDLLAQARAAQGSPGPVESDSLVSQLIDKSRAVMVLTAALHDDPATALWEALWHWDMLRPDEQDRMRMALLRSARDEVERQG
ncbi:DUF6461 domain-containing protein [Nonomuraea typhae]|uniref:DUF6461 domain-containing protein n=1 Tax=Nonomuraea typhae TaxID=2603600 RepID=A0ABW7ZCQ4_9ACTN